MARLTLDTNPKFKLLVHRLGLPRPYVRGLLETLWDVANACGEPVIGEADAVEAAAEWPGDPGVLFAALRDTRMIDPADGERWEIHDYWDHAPDYVRKRRAREQSRREKGKSLRADRSTADNGGQRQPLVNTRAPAPAHTLTPTSTPLSLDLPVEATNGSGDKPPPGDKRRRQPAEIPAALVAAIPDFAKLWAKRMKNAGRKKPGESAELDQLALLEKTLAEHGKQVVLDAVEVATVGGYQGIFPKPQQAGRGGGPRTSSGGRWPYPDAAADFE